MAVMNQLEIFLEFEPIVKLVCNAVDCKYNLVQCANDASRTMPACNLKQITMKLEGVCGNYERVKKQEKE